MKMKTNANMNMNANMLTLIGPSADAIAAQPPAPNGDEPLQVTILGCLLFGLLFLCLNILLVP